MNLIHFLEQYIGPSEAIAGLIGAILVLGASFFKDIGIPIQAAPWYKKVLFVFCGYLIGLLLYIKNPAEGSRMDLFYCASIGGGWIYIVSGFLNSVRVFNKASQDQKASSEKAIKINEA